MKRILITLLICTGIVSCTKDDNVKKDSYLPADVVIADEPVMYTNNGISHDQAVMKDYLKRRGVLASYAFDHSTPSTASLSSYSLEFQTGKNVLIGKTNAEIIDQNDSLMMIALLDSSVPEVGEKSWSDSLMDRVNKNGPLAECPAYYTAPCPYRKKYPLQIIDGQYYIPYVVATVSTNAFIPTDFGVLMDYTYFTFKAGESMLFNTDVTGQLGGTLSYTFHQNEYTLDRYDTVIVQTMRRHLIKQ
jgi:hypothetical protein